MSKSKISQLTDPKRVAEAAKDRSSREHAMLRGALGAIEKGGTTVPVDESTVAKATHYGRVLSGADEQRLGEKHYGEIAKLVETFLIGPQKVRKVSSMKPSELSKELRRIASAIDNSENPSRELILKEIKRIASRISADQSEVNNHLNNIKARYDKLLRSEGYIGDFVQEGIYQIEDRDPNIISKYYAGYTDEQLKQVVDLMKRYL